MGYCIYLESSLQYFEARYYDNSLGRFVEQDPVFWEIGQTRRGIGVLQDPQQMNSYSYARNNPVTLIDPTGEIAETPWDAALTVQSAAGVVYKGAQIFGDLSVAAYGGITGNDHLVNAATTGLKQHNEEMGSAVVDLGANSAALLLPGVPAGWNKAPKLVDKVGDVAKVAKSSEKATAFLNRLNHIFGKAEHNLKGLVKQFGSEEKAFQAVQAVANKALQEGKIVAGKGGILPKVGVILEVAGTKVQLIGGRIKDGAVEISSFSRKIFK